MEKKYIFLIELVHSNIKSVLRAFLKERLMIVIIGWLTMVEMIGGILSYLWNQNTTQDNSHVIRQVMGQFNGTASTLGGHNFVTQHQLASCEERCKNLCACD